MDTGAGGGPALLPEWRLMNTRVSDYAHPDWPIPVDLSYSDADLHSAALGGFPLGDLNWFPVPKLVWLSQRDAEYENLDHYINVPVAVTANDAPEKLQLDQNYPNPFNPKTVISGQWPVGSEVRLEVFDILGRSVATLANGRYPAGKYSFTFDGTNLASGVYFYRLTAGSFTAVRKMILTK